MSKNNQLQLLPTPRREWQLTEETKNIGRAGLAQARLALKPADHSKPTTGTVQSISKLRVSAASNALAA